MNNKNIAIICFSLGFGIISFLWAVTFTVMADDLKKEVIYQKYYIKELERKNKQTIIHCEEE